MPLKTAALINNTRERRGSQVGNAATGDTLRPNARYERRSKSITPGLAVTAADMMKRFSAVQLNQSGSCDLNV